MDGTPLQMELAAAFYTYLCEDLDILLCADTFACFVLIELEHVTLRFFDET